MKTLLQCSYISYISLYAFSHVIVRIKNLTNQAVSKFTVYTYIGLVSVQQNRKLEFWFDLGFNE